MIQLHGIRYSIGARVLFDDLTWVLAPGDRVALLGLGGGISLGVMLAEM